MPLIKEVRKLYHRVKRLAAWRPGDCPATGNGSRRTAARHRLASLGAICLLSGCSGLSLPGLEGAAGSDKSYARLLGDMPLPRGARIVGDNTLILGGGADWTGRIAIVTDLGWADTFAFYRDQYPAQGWALVSSLQARNSILVFIKGERTATVEITPASLLGTKSSVLMTVAPKADEEKQKKPR